MTGLLTRCSKSSVARIDENGVTVSSPLTTVVEVTEGVLGADWDWRVIFIGTDPPASPPTPGKCSGVVWGEVMKHGHSRLRFRQPS